MAHRLAKQGKPFNCVELIELCLIGVVKKKKRPEKINSFKSVSFSLMRVAGRVEDIGNNTNRRFVLNEANGFQWFSLAFDKVADVPDAAHRCPRGQQ